MGKYDGQEWEKVEDLSTHIRELEIPKEILIEFFKNIFKISEAEGV
jgi:hypothetical protein